MGGQPELHPTDQAELSSPEKNRSDFEKFLQDFTALPEELKRAVLQIMTGGFRKVPPHIFLELLADRGWSFSDDWDPDHPNNYGLDQDGSFRYPRSAKSPNSQIPVSFKELSRQLQMRSNSRQKAWSLKNERK